MAGIAKDDVIEDFDFQKLTGSNEILRPNLEKYLKPGARVVSHEYVVPGWKPKLVEKADEAEPRPALADAFMPRLLSTRNG